MKHSFRKLLSVLLAAVMVFGGAASPLNTGWLLRVCDFLVYFMRPARAFFINSMFKSHTYF